MPEISIKNISKSYYGKKVLNDVSLDVEKGDIYGVLGLSGAGKSTLVRCINCLETFEDGEIYYKDELLCSPSKKISRDNQRKIQMIFQHFNLLQQRTVLGNVELALEFAHIGNKKTRKEKALAALERVGLKEKASMYPSKLSGGQKQRVAIARALVLEPEVILSDESTSALDPETTIQILDLLKELNKTLGLTIIMISHQMNVIEQICNKVAIIDSAKIVENGSLSDVFLNPQTEIARGLLFSNHVNTKLSHDRIIRMIFDGNADEPILADLIQQCQILVSVVYADSKVIDSKVYGQLAIKMPENDNDRIKVEKYLNLKKISFEEVNIKEVNE
jgi:D-methionine transport system ATP-binding protein